MIEVYEASRVDEHFFSEIDKWSCGLWCDFEEAEIKACYIAFDGGNPIGFQSINADGLTVAIEVHPEYQGKGISRLLIEESGSTKPERNENPEFWEAVYGW
jgi:GNAT superfamily N-acetyltransferase